MKFKKGDVVQYNEKHEWKGCLGYITEVSPQPNGDVKYTVGVPVPYQGTAYLFVMERQDCIEYVGKAVLMPRDS